MRPAHQRQYVSDLPLLASQNGRREVRVAQPSKATRRNQGQAIYPRIVGHTWYPEFRWRQLVAAFRNPAPNVDIVEAHPHLIDGLRRESVGKSNRRAVRVFITDTGAGIAAVRQSRQRSRTDIRSSALRITDKYLVTLRNVIVQANISLVDAITLNRRNREIVTLSGLWCRVEICVSLGSWIDAARRNNVSGKWQTSRRIVDGWFPCGREIANSFLQRGNGRYKCEGIANPCSLVIDEPEKLVCHDRSTESRTKLVLLERGFLLSGIFEVIARV